MCKLDEEATIALDLHKALRMIDADKSDPYDRDGRHEVLIPPGRYPAERIENPFNRSDKPWLVLKGTKIGLAEVYLRTHDGVRIDGALDRLKVFRAAYARLEMALVDLHVDELEKLERETKLKEIDAYARRLHGIASSIRRFPRRIAAIEERTAALMVALHAARHELTQAEQAERKLANLVQVNQEGLEGIASAIAASTSKDGKRSVMADEDLRKAGEQRKELLETRRRELETFRKERLAPARHAFENAERAFEWPEALAAALSGKRARAESLLTRDLDRAQGMIEGIASVARAVEAIAADREAACGLDLDDHIRIMEEVRRNNRNHGNGDASAA